MLHGSVRLFQLRRDLERSSQQYQGKSFLIVKDPVTRRYFRFTEAQATILGLLETPTDAETLARLASEKLGANLSLATMSAFLDSLEGKYLLDTPAVREKLGTDKLEAPNKNSILYRKVASINPEKLFDWLVPRTRWAFTPAFQILGIALIVSGFTITYLQWDHLIASTPDLLNWTTVLMVWPIVFSVSAYHEFSHGLTCRHFGGKVHEVGFMLIYFSPAFYCDVSDSWMFPSRRNRILVTLAGGYSQLMLWGLSTIIWRLTDPYALINRFVLVIVLFSGIQTLMNFNPLIKLDGYYMLSDYLEIPNLREKAFNTLWRRVAGKPGPPVSRDERAQLLYGMASYLFSTSLLVLIYMNAYRWAAGRWQFAGIVGFSLFSIFTLKKTGAESYTGFKALMSRLAVRRVRNAILFAIVVMVLIFVKWELRVFGDFEIQANRVEAMTARTSGYVSEVLVARGMTVKKGDTILKLASFELSGRLAALDGELREANAELDRLLGGNRREDIEVQERILEARQAELRSLRQNDAYRNQLRQELEKSKANRDGARDSLMRATNLLREGLTPQSEFDAIRTAAAAAESEVRVKEAAIESLDEATARDVGVKEKDVATAEGELKSLLAGANPLAIQEVRAKIASIESLIEVARTEEESLTVRSTLDGVVTSDYTEKLSSRTMQPGDDIVSIADIHTVKVDLLISEREIKDVHEGNKVWLKVASFPADYFEGEVKSISPEAVESGGRPMFIVRVDLPNPGGDLAPGMTGVAKIDCGERRLIDLATRRIRYWFSTEVLARMPF